MQNHEIYFYIMKFLLQYLLQMIINLGMDLTLEFGWTGWTPWWTSYEGREMGMNATDVDFNVTTLMN